MKERDCTYFQFVYNTNMIIHSGNGTIGGFCGGLIGGGVAPIA
jgi:hypothetical protein